MEKAHMIRYLTIAALSVVLFAGADWARFRGPNGTGVSYETGLPLTWSATENVVWKTPLPGFGSSSPITLGDKIFLTSYSGYGLDQDQPGNQGDLVLHTLCLDRASGRILWNKTTVAALPETPYDGGRIALHGFASSTPVTDGKAVYFFLGRSGVSKYSLNGERLWNVSVGTDLDKHNWGSGTSLILHDGLLIVNASAESKSIRALRASKCGKSIGLSIPGARRPS
jgi:outer membrane protein assembly factor BamB